MTGHTFWRYGRPIILSVGMAFIFYWLFDLGLWEGVWAIMSLSFFFGLPYLAGVVVIYACNKEVSKKVSFRILFPWLSILIFFVTTLLLSMEGWACWIMILPVFLMLSSLGGLTAGYLRDRESRNADRLHLSLALVLPLIASPIEQLIGPEESNFTVYTFVDIGASKEIIWSNVTRVSEIPSQQDTRVLGKLLGIPSPVEAQLDFEGLNAVRTASFTGGLIFTETVIAYDHQEYMAFSITPNTGEIPSTTFDDHVLIGGEYFNVLEGSYKLELISPDTYRLHLWSEFQLNTTFNFYSGLWAGWIMKDIQQNILNVIKSRSETAEFLYQ